MPRKEKSAKNCRKSGRENILRKDDGRLDFYEAFRKNVICVENFPRYNIVPYERKVCRNYDHLENAFRRNAILFFQRID